MTKLNEILHPSHPEHKLKLDYTEMPFKCDGCKELGIGSHYNCDICNFDLHRHCAIASPSIYHRFYAKCSFQFLLNPPQNIPRTCDACGKDVTGFVYHCKKSGWDLHPCCAKLPDMLDVGDTKLYLHKKLSKSCKKCGRRHGWSYRPQKKEYQLGVGCVMEMIEENWHDVLVHGRNGTLTRIPNLNNMLQAHGTNGNRNKICELIGVALRAVIGVLLGDPSPLIAGVIQLFMFED